MSPSRPVGGHEKAIQRAAAAIAENGDVVLVNVETDEVTVTHQNVRQAEAAYAAILGALCEELPEPVILAGVQRAFDRHITQPNDIQRKNVVGTFQAMLRELMDHDA